ncbi:MAG: sialate O-acetylesterase [Verrucomicrobia bacterium]|nr:sialate O-acetylesterase [Verrucomicrobiota bacterium]
MIIFRRLLVPLLFAALTGAIRADVTPAALFGDHAVLQRDKLVPVWGRADAGEKVTVIFGAQIRSATAGSDGSWIVFLDPLSAATQGADLTIAGRNTIILRNIVVGEVWLCSGQSNMEFAVSRAANAAQEIATANFPLLRHVRIEHAVAEAPTAATKTDGWKAATPENVGGFTAVGYFFARDIFQKLGVPVGLVHSSWGGTPVEAWMSPAAMAGNPAFRIAGERWQQTLAAYPQAKADYEAQLASWTKAQAAAKGPAAQAAWAKNNPRPRVPRGAGDPWTPTGLFNGMINPLLPYALRGVLWYQGENNADRASEYHALFAAMITHWRAHFGQGDIPFFWVNLANFKNNGDQTGRNYAFLREAQTQTLSLPNTGQALAIDIGNPNDIHPTNKQDVGRRLALLAKTRIYGIVGDDTGPTFAGIGREGLALRVRFAHAGGGLIAHDKPVQSLEIAGADRVFHRAEGKIERDTLLVSSPAVRDPVAVRYAWQNAPEANLYNGAGLPAVPFRSDVW